MAVRAECTHIATESNQTIKVELIGASYGGASREVKGAGSDWARLYYDQLDFTDLFGTVVQRGRLDFSYWVQDATDESILSDVIAAGQGEYTLKISIAGSQYWVGEVMLDQLGAQEEGMSYPYRVRLTAKDFTTLEKGLFPLEDNRQTIAKIAGRILNETGYGLNIWTHTSWTEENINSSNDFMRQIYADTRNLREFGKDQDLQITNLDALTRILEPFRCIVRQEAGVFTISQWSEYDVPSAVLRTVYDADGDYVSQSSVNTTVSANDTVQVVAGSVSEFKPGYKRVLANYAHRTQTSGIQVPDVVMLDETNTSDLFEQVIEINASDINQRISLNTTAFVNFDEEHTGAAIGTEPKVGVILALTIEGVAKYWNNSSGAWQNTTVTNQFSTRSKTPVGKLIELPEQTYQNFVASVNITTTSLTFVNNGLSGFGTISLTLVRANTGALASETVYEGTSLVVGSNNNTDTSQSIGYSLTNQANFSKNYNAGSYYFGDGPLKSSPGALRYGTGNLQTVGDWGRRGDTPIYLFYQQNLKEVMDLYRGWNKVMTARILNVGYDTTKSLTYLTKSYNAIGGTFDGYTGWWTALVFENSLATDVTDSFDLALLSSGTALTTGAYTAARLNSQDTLERSGGYVFILASEISGTVTQLTVKNLLTEFPQLKQGMEIRVVHPITLDDFIFEVAEDMFTGSLVIQVVEVELDSAFPAGSYIYTNPGDATAALIIGRDSIRLIAESTSVGVTTTESLGSVTSIQVVLNTRVQAGDDLFLVRTLDAVKRAFTVGQTAGPGLVTLQLDQPTVFDAPAGSYIIGSNAQYEAFLQVTPAGVLAKAEAVTTQNSFAILSAPLPSGIPTTEIPVTSVKTLKILNASQIGVQDKAGNTEFFTVDGEQNLTPATTTIDVISKTPSVSVGSGAGVFQPMWNQTAILSVQAGEIATRVTSSEVQTLIDQNIDGLLPALSLPFENSAEGFTGTNATLTTDATYLEYLATGTTPYMQRATSYDADTNPIVTIRVQRVAGTNWGGAFGWSTDGTNFTTQNFLEPSGVDLDFQFTTLDLTSNVNYTGTIVAIRIYLGEANLDEFYIDTLSVGKFNPQTEILADLSSRLTVAEAGLTNTANEFTTYTQNGVLLNGSAKVNEIRNATTMYDTVVITDTRGGFTVKNNQDYYLVNTDGTFQAVKIRDDQTIANESSPTNVTLKIQSITFATTIQVGAMLHESAFTQSTRISQSAGQIVLKAQESAGEVTSLALVRLDASAASGSAVKIQGDLVAINDIQITRGAGAAAGVIQTSNFVSGSTGWRIRGTGNAEFNDVTVRGSVFVTGGNAATQNYADGVAQTVNVTIRSATEPTQRVNETALVAGDIWINTASGQGDLPYSWNGSSWVRTYTVIDGGNISTGTLNANNVTIQNAASNPDIVLDGTGITLKQIEATNDTEIRRSIHWINKTSSATEENQSRIVSYAGGTDIAVDVAGTQNAKDMRFSVRRNISGNQDLSIGVAGIAGSFVTGSAVGDAVISVSNGKLFFTQRNTSAGTTSVYSLPFGSSELITQTTGDSRYVRPAETNVFTGENTFYTEKFLITDTVTGGVIFKTAVQTDFRTLTIPTLTANRTFAFIDQAQTFSNDQTFGHGRLKVRNTGNNGSATLIYGTASADRTYTFAGANGTVWTSGNLPITDIGMGESIPNTRLTIQLGGNTYQISARIT